MMKFSFVILLICLFVIVGCDSDSNLNTFSSSSVSSVGPTETLDVPAMYSTIQAAINAAGNGDFIRVAAGEYSEDLVITGKNFSLRGAGTGESIILGLIEVYNTSETSLEGFTVKGGGIHVKNSPVRITGNEILSSVTAGLWLEGCDNVVISDNVITNSGKEGVLVDDSSGVIGSLTVSNNATDGIVVNNSSPTLLDNNVFSNGGDGISIRGFVSYSAPLLLSNTVQENGGKNNYDIICFGGNTNPTGSGNVFDRCINCAECRTFGDPVTYQE